MPIQKQDRRTQWTLDQPDSQWELARNATIKVTDQHGIYEATAGSDIQVSGNIDVRGEGYAGVRFMGSNSTLAIGADALIKARDGAEGVFAEGAGQLIVNRGAITADGFGIRGAIWGEVKNFGTISAVSGIFYEGAGSKIINYGRIEAYAGVDLRGDGTNEVINTKHGVIDASSFAIHGNYDCELIVLNAGLIKSGQDAIFTAREGASLNLENTGKIIGDLWLGEASNYIDTSKGEIIGTIHGGPVDDLYIIGQSKLNIVELADGGFDELHAHASYRLSDNIENLYLNGTKDIAGAGNAGDNNIHGNKGDNRLTGNGGEDFLAGRQGNDVLTGGNARDLFIFEKNGGRDTITDFDDGIDEFSLGFFVSEDDFENLDIKQIGDDTVIDLGPGDRIIFRDFERSDLDYSDLAAT